MTLCLLCQLNSTAGNIDKNVSIVHQYVYFAHKQNADIVVFDELFLTGYNAKDILFEAEFMLSFKKAIKSLEKISSRYKVNILVGGVYYEKNKVYNVVYHFFDGVIQKIIFKNNLPDYNMFDEKRYFTSPEWIQTPDDIVKNSITEINGLKVAIVVCEDLWIEEYIEALKGQNIDVVLSVNASPFTITKVEERKICCNKANEIIRPQALFYLNKTGYEDYMVFDGHTTIYHQSKMIHQANFQDIILILIDIVKKDNGDIHMNIMNEKNQEAQEEHDIENDAVDSSQYDSLSKIDLVSNPLRCFERAQECAPMKIRDTFKMTNTVIYNVYTNICHGISEFYHRNDFKKIIIGLSGGIDSTLLFAMLLDILGKDAMIPVFLPSEYTSSHSYSCVKELLKEAGVFANTLHIDSIMHQYDQLLLNFVNPLIENNASQNIQSRIRANILMNIANMNDGMVLATSNKVELGTGYFSLYGDSCGAIAPLGDLYKSQIYQIAIACAEGLISKCRIPYDIITRPPTAELKHDQIDTDDYLIEYDEIEELIYRYLECNETLVGVHNYLIHLSQDKIAKVIDQINQNEFKRFQCPPIINCNKKSFSSGRRYPSIHGRTFF